MTDEEKLTEIKTIMGIAGTSSDSIINTYLANAKRGILNWKYSLVGGVPETVTDVGAEDENAQIWAVIAGMNIRGAENQKIHDENGIIRHFEFASMMSYIKSNVIPFAGVGHA